MRCYNNVVSSTNITSKGKQIEKEIYTLLDAFFVVCFCKVFGCTENKNTRTCIGEGSSLELKATFGLAIYRDPIV